MTPPSAALDDVVDSFDQVAVGSREPLLVLDVLEQFLDEQSIGSGPLRAEPIGEGHSNVTFVLTREDTRVIVRRPPRPPIAPSAHDVIREARVIQALEGTARVPKIMAICDDKERMGAPFVVMEYVEGNVITSGVPEAIATPAGYRRIGEELIDSLVEIHAVRWQDTPMNEIGRPNGYLERQVRRFTELWGHHKTREIQAVDEVSNWLAEHLPESGPPTVVHGDFRLGNVIFAATPPATVITVLDWEMAAVGDPLTDVGYLSATWADRLDPPNRMTELTPVTRQQGFPTRLELLDRYCFRSGRSLESLSWYETLALWKSAIFMEGNFRRAQEGATDDPHLLEFGDGVEELAERALALTATQN